MWIFFSKNPFLLLHGLRGFCQKSGQKGHFVSTLSTLSTGLQAPENTGFF
jgi:hypothetical protein